MTRPARGYPAGYNIFHSRELCNIPGSRIAEDFISTSNLCNPPADENNRPVRKGIGIIAGMADLQDRDRPGVPQVLQDPDAFIPVPGIQGSERFIEEQD